MLIVADNMTTRNKRVRQAFQGLQSGKAEERETAAAVLRELAQQCSAAGATVLEINTQQHVDRPEALALAVESVQQVTDRQLCLSFHSLTALEAGLKACERPPMVNYVSMDEARLRDVLTLAARYGAEVVLLLLDPSMPSDAREMVKRAAVLIGAANEAGISDERIWLDPGLVHVISDVGQRHFVDVLEFLRILPDAFEPPVRSVCWVSNASAGVPEHLRPVVNTGVLAMLSGLGLSAAFLDVFKPENMRMTRVIRMLKNEAIYAERELELSPVGAAR